MKSKAKKSEELRQLKEKIPGSKIVVFTTFSRAHSAGSGQAGEKGLSVSQMTELKRALRSLNSQYFVTKKSLMDLALKGLSLSVSRDGIDVFGMEGSVGLVLGGGDPYEISKKLYEFSKKNQALRFFGAFMDGSFLNLERFMEIAKMPSREVLIGRLLGMLTYPVRGLAVVLNEISKKQIS